MSGRQKALLAVALGLLLWAPSGISETSTPIVTGHSTFYNGDTYDPCLASIAGIMRSRVMWFNDQVLVERYGGKGTFIFATQYGAPDPRDRAALYSEGVFYDFTDPNGVFWRVEEAWYSDVWSPGYEGGGKIPDPMRAVANPGSAGASAEYNATTVADEDKYYVWFVELSANPIYDEFNGADPHRYYNFLNLVDTCKFNREKLGDEYIGTERHEGADLNADNGHPNGAEAHDHEKFVIDLWVGKRPATMPFGEVSSNPGSWESSWAAQYPQQETAEGQYAANQSVPEGFEESLP